MATGTVKTGPQDLPPSGGYGPVQFERIKLRQILSAKSTLLTYAACTGLGFFVMFYEYRQIRRERVEQLSGRFAIQALLQAERDRQFLKQVRRNRDAEADLMKDYPGWQVGKLFDEARFIGDDPDKFIEPNISEYFAHARCVGGFLHLFNYSLNV
ncbi:NADH dehydrogenase [ubiquinone] 1 alpha subcomplex subunit 13 [Cephus cinctus]|uniref:NADH dehydrogenase [ubiquinone] 1 alpha subcomplex subunit 13 n=1 Tax=Cephus cinctus TaxID=211228 RepID=A0AAJ7BLN1_CEPCN|nr:NADH dehydrogenase [ubiquinone] 1 alpha subcomplex subunit 13 [Cephus cinctus]